MLTTRHREMQNEDGAELLEDCVPFSCKDVLVGLVSDNIWPYAFFPLKKYLALHMEYINITARK